MTTMMVPAFDDPAFRQYLPRVRRMARSLARGVRRPWDREDLDQEARLALCEALRSYPGPEVVPLDFHVYGRVHWRIMAYLRAGRPLGHRHRRSEANRHAAYPDRPLMFSELADAGGEVPDFASLADDPVGWEIASEDWVVTVADRLTPRRALLMKLHYLSAAGESFADCARLMGITLGRAYQIHQEAVIALRTELSGTAGRVGRLRRRSTG
jgi:RNA polymerase sigma factor (sigma-70 family)